MASVEICGRNHNLISSCDDLSGLRIHMLSVSCKFEVCAIFIWLKENNYGKSR